MVFAFYFVAQNDLVQHEYNMLRKQFWQFLIYIHYGACKYFTLLGGL